MLYFISPLQVFISFISLYFIFNQQMLLLFICWFLMEKPIFIYFYV